MESFTHLRTHPLHRRGNARRDVAIVSPQAGTTRDAIEVHLDLDGYPVMLIDTAGIHDTTDPIEQEGIRRAKARAADADLIFWLVDGRIEEGGVAPDPDELSRWMAEGQKRRPRSGVKPSALSAAAT